MKNKTTFVTSFSEDGYNRYGKQMLESVAKFWDKDLNLVCFYHDFDINSCNPPISKNIQYRNLNEVQDLLDYRETFKQYDGIVSDNYNWRMDAIKWCHKVFALSEQAFDMAEESVQAGWMVWLDADTVTTKPFSAKDIEPYLNENVSLVHLGRTSTDYSETSFVGFNINRENAIRFIADLRGAYISGEVLSYREWHDGFIFERLLNIYKAHGTNVHNLTPDVKDLDAFGVSPLSQWMIHFKGNKKNSIAEQSSILPNPNELSTDVNGPKRYGQLLKVVQHYNPSSIIETGTWNGGRAIQMAEAVFSTGATEVEYTGFDLFEDATDETDKVEFNTKKHNTLEAVTARLEEYKQKKKEEGKDFYFVLHKGNTKETLVKFPVSADLAYIDGGHSYETVHNDYKLINSPIRIFNSFFSTDINDKLPSPEVCGVNDLVKELAEEITENDKKWRIKVIPSTDPVLNGGVAHLAVLLTEDSTPELPEELFRIPIVINPKDCMPDDYIINNINTNLKLIEDDKWMKRCRMTDDQLITISGGNIDYKKLKTTLKTLKAQKIKYKIACVKHAYPELLKRKIFPDYCIILDPRPIDGLSTHNVLRKDLFKDIRKDTLFLVASMTDPSVTQYLLDKKANIKLWHAYSEAIRDKTSTDELKTKESCDISDDAVLVSGGTCAAMRTMGMFHVLGFRTFQMFGFDCSVEEPSEEEKKELLDTGQMKYMKVETNGNHFWTTGELLAMAQDCEKLFSRQDIDFNIIFNGSNTLVYEVFKSSLKSKEISYSELCL
tara:strand:+ start:1189 stop:3519 length:2331 start_codon:yes stop_codon:yes gene_type:complete